MIFKILTIVNFIAVSGLYALILVAMRQVKKKKKTLVSVKQVSPKK